MGVGADTGGGVEAVLPRKFRCRNAASVFFIFLIFYYNIYHYTYKKYNKNDLKLKTTNFYKICKKTNFHENKDSSFKLHQSSFINYHSSFKIKIQEFIW